MPGLTKEQIETFQRDGAIVVKEAVTPTVLSALKEEFSVWVDESRAQTSAYGEICDGRPRFDLDDDHTADHPSLRRVASPTDISQVYSEAAFDSAITDMAADLVGPNVRFHHAKVNSKLPGTKTVVKWHQDFTFDPHSNQTQYDKNDIAVDMMHILESGVKVWEYPVLNESERK